MSTTYFALGNYAARGTDPATQLRAGAAAAVVANPLGLLIADRIAREARARTPSGEEGEEPQRNEERRDRGGGFSDEDLTANEASLVAALASAAAALGRIAQALEDQVENQGHILERLAAGGLGSATTPRARARGASKT